MREILEIGRNDTKTQEKVIGGNMRCPTHWSSHEWHAAAAEFILPGRYIIASIAGHSWNLLCASCWRFIITLPGHRILSQLITLITTRIHVRAWKAPATGS
jgi:hypothetical protein